MYVDNLISSLKQTVRFVWKMPPKNQLGSNVGLIDVCPEQRPSRYSVPFT